MFTYKLIAPDGVVVEYTTIKKFAKELIENHEQIVGYFDKMGWYVIKTK